MKYNFLLIATVISGCAYSSDMSTLFEQPPEKQYRYLVTIYENKDVAYKHSMQTTGINQFSDIQGIKYRSKTCEKSGKREKKTNTIEEVESGYVYRIDVYTKVLKVTDLSIDASAYTKPFNDECTNTGKVKTIVNKYSFDFDLSTTETQTFIMTKNKKVTLNIQEIK